jgi:hypothetical protein
VEHWSGTGRKKEKGMRENQKIKDFLSKSSYKDVPEGVFDDILND